MDYYIAVKNELFILQHGSVSKTEGKGKLKNDIHSIIIIYINKKPHKTILYINHKSLWKCTYSMNWNDTHQIHGSVV